MRRTRFTHQGHAPQGAMPRKPGTTVEMVIDGLGTLRNVYG